MTDLSKQVAARQRSHRASEYLHRKNVLRVCKVLAPKMRLTRSRRIRARIAGALAS